MIRFFHYVGDLEPGSREFLYVWSGIYAGWIALNALANVLLGV